MKRTIVLCGVFLAFVLSAAQSQQPAPAFTLEAADGTAVTLPEPRDGVDIYYFWATWCPFCERIKPHLQALVDDHGDRVRVFAINFREREGRDPVAHLSEGGYDFTLLLNGEVIADDYDAWVLPGIFVVDGGGDIRFSLYENPMPNPEGYEELSSVEQSEIRAPWWGARVREVVEELL